MIDIASLLSELARMRPIFHSEADFQHALAWEIHFQQPGSSIRLEYRHPSFHERAYLDIWATNQDAKVAIELKYKTRRLRVMHNGENFDLLDQSAQDIGRYDFVKDIHRLEQVVSANVVGHAILLTNDSAYWKPPRDKRSVDASFRLDEGRDLAGKSGWAAEASAGTTRGREEAIEIRGKYTFNWHDYSQPGSAASCGKFRYLLVNVVA